MAAKTIGYIGLGNAGYPMAANLPKAGFDLVVMDADKSRAEKFVRENKNSKVAGDGEDAFKDVDVLITMLPNGKVVREALLGQQGYARGLKPGTVIIDTSSSSPFDTRSLGADLKNLSLDLELIDSPITQDHLHAIDTAGATLMVGADSQTALDKALPVLKAMSKYVFVMGGLGSGHAMKTLNNYVSVGSIIALCDALVAGQKFGLDPEVMVDVLNVGTGRNFSTAYSMRDEGLTRRYQSGYQLALLVKDMKITKEVIESVGFETKLPDLAIQYLSEAQGVVEPDACHTQCLKGWEHRAGIELKKSAQPTTEVAKEDGWKPRIDKVGSMLGLRDGESVWERVMARDTSVTGVLVKAMAVIGALSLADSATGGRLLFLHSMGDVFGRFSRRR